jgi:hypothetical protein
MIFTLEARGNVTLPVIANMFKLNNEQCIKVILNEFEELKRKLLAKGIDYTGLKSSLIPVHKGKKELALIFDRNLILDYCYGSIVFNCILPAMNKESTYSILCGDISINNVSLKTGYNIIFENLVQFHPTDYKCPDQYFVVYFNNLTNMQMKSLLDALNSVYFFIGYVDVTFSSRLKTILAYSLVHLGIKHRDLFILQHEEDLHDEENVNCCGFDFERHGFKYISINSMYFDLFLSYKIESAFADSDDLKYSLREIRSCVNSVLNLPVTVTENKLLYLKEQKTEIMEKLGLKNYTVDKLEDLIKSSIKKSYLYNLEFIEQHNVPKFSVSLELETIDSNMRKVLVALKYSLKNDAFELITMY